MSRLIIIAGAIGLAFGLSGPALADSNTGNITQFGTSNTASIDQTTNVADASSNIYQNGSSNTATSVQGNNIYFGTTYPVTNWITQYGTSNLANVTQDQAYGSAGYVYQSGDANTATINQTYFTDYSNATIWQYGGASGNSGTINQTLQAYSSGFINQYGSNTVDSNATINQVGTSGDLSWYLSATIEQINARGATANINQSGFSNSAYILQDTTLSGYYSYLNALITQGGDNNVAKISQTTSDYLTSANIYQVGDHNKAEIDQPYVWYSSANIGQWWGSYNTAKIVQASMSYGDAQIIQGGNGNTGTITQGYPESGCCGYALSAQIWQFGDSNNASIEQSYYGQDAIISQNGVSNTAKVSQTGNAYLNHNVANVTQTGSFHVANVAQNGAGNHATINQH